MLGIFTKLFHILEAVCNQLDLELANHTTDVDSSSFSQVQPGTSKTSIAPSRPRKCPACTGSVAAGCNIRGLSKWREKTLAVDLLKQSTEKKKSVKALVSHYPTQNTQNVSQLSLTIGSKSGQMHSCSEKGGILKKKGLLSRFLTMHCNRSVCNASSILVGHLYLLAIMSTKHYR